MTNYMDIETTPPPCLPSTKLVLAALKPGQRHAQPIPPGSGDAWMLADLARASRQTARRAVRRASGRAAPGRGNPAVRAGIARAAVPRLGNTALRRFSPHQDLISERLRTLHALMQNKRRHPDGSGHDSAVPACAARIPGRLHILVQAGRRAWTKQALRRQLTLANYTHVTQVTAPGEFCIRGGLIDLFPMGSVLPYRLDLFDDEIESIRSFDIDTQRSLYPVKEVQMLPGREFPMDETARNRVPGALSRAIRRRPIARPALQRHRQWHRVCRHRILPAAVLRRTRPRCSITCARAVVYGHAGRYRTRPCDASPRTPTTAISS